MSRGQASESAHARALVQWWTHACGRYGCEPADLLHIPNGGARRRSEAARMKGEGVRPGAPDYLLTVPTPAAAGLFVELKTERGRVSQSQRETLERLTARGYRAEVCRGWHKARETIEDYLACQKRRLN